jgi:3-hydroxyisobutyrate dehydrogenase/2-hydroxy-3-oxopropionate reductase
VVVQMSTVSPSSVTRPAGALPACTGLLDAPVLGSVAEAGSGGLRILVGGPRALVERCLPLLEQMAAKLVANNALFGVLGVLGESLALGGALGLVGGPA